MPHRLRLVLLAAIVFLGACIETDATSVVGADGAASSIIRVEIDLERLETLFGGLGDGGIPAETDETDSDETGTDETDASPIPDLIAEVEAQSDALEAQVADLYEQRPELRDSLRIESEVTNGALITEIAAVTDDVDDLAVLYGNVLGSEADGLGAIYGFDDAFLNDPASGTGGGGVGLLGPITVELGDQFRFEAAPPAGGTFDENIELDFDSGFFESLRPEIRISVTAPGDIVETNGDADGRTVSWLLTGTESDPIVLVSDIDPSATAPGLLDSDAFGSTGSATVAIVVGLLALAGLAVAAVVLMRRSRRRREPPAALP